MKFTNKILSGTVVAAVYLACSASPLMAAMDMHLSIPGVKGESVASGFQGQIDVYSFSWGVSTPITIGSSGGGDSVGKPSFSSLNLMVPMDSSSTPLFYNCASGTKLTDPVVLSMTKVIGGSNQVFATITLSNVYVTSIQLSGSTGGDTTESLSLTYGSIQWGYSPQNVQGQLGKAIVHSWNIASNTGN